MPKVKTRSEFKREQILDAAGCHFTKEGFSATSMEAVAKTAGVSKQTVYSHFGNKEELFRSAIADKCEKLRSFDDLFENLGPAEPTLLSFCREFFNLVTSPEAISVHRICVSESVNHPNLSKLFYSAAPEFIIGELTKCLAQYDSRGELCIPSPRNAAMQLLSMVKGEQWMQIELNIEPSLSPTEVEQYICSSVRLFMQGYSCKN